MRDGEIAASVALRPVVGLAREKLGITEGELTPYGHYKAKISLPYLDSALDRPPGKLVLVTAMTPTPAGEGKTTTSIGLSDGLNRLGVRSTVCLREPSLGPCFGMKGGATGGGYAQVAPMEDINLHFNGDMHAITSANNMLASILDNHLYWGNSLDIDPEGVSWRRAIDLNERVLRSLPLRIRRGMERAGAFDITAASEVMAVFCLARDLKDLEKRLGDIVVARKRDGALVHARDLGVAGAMTALLVDALAPNLVQSLEHNPAVIHGGPFANIAHGCNSLIATRTALALSEVAVTEAGFGADLGAEKFLDIKCRQSGLRPDAVVLVGTIRALKMHGGVQLRALQVPDPEAVRRGVANLRRHVENLRQFGLSPVVAINHFEADTQEEVHLVSEALADMGVRVVQAKHWAKGGEGAEELARAVLDSLAQRENNFTLLYPDELPLREKIRMIATRIYRAADVDFDAEAEAQLDEFESLGYGHFPVCIAKTQYSFSADPDAKGAPENFVLPLRSVRLSAGAGFVVALCGDVMTMPGLPREPAAFDIGVDDDGRIFGL